MDDDNPDNRRQLVARPAGLPTEAGWAKKAVEVTNPLQSFTFGVRAHANMRAMQTAIQHAKVFGTLMEVAADTVGKMQRTQDAMREQTVRQELSAELFGGEIDRQRNVAEEAKHQRALAAKRREMELLESDQKVLQAKHSLEATKKFKAMKFKLGEVRAEARQRDAEVDKATAEAAASELGQKRQGAGNEGNPAAAWLDQHISALQDKIKNGDADGEDTAQLHADLEVLRRLRADL